MKLRLFASSLLPLLAWSAVSTPAFAATGGGGGRIVSLPPSGGQMQLAFESRTGCTYQVQSNANPTNRFWSDALPLLTGTDTRGSALVAATNGMGFCRVLEFTNRVFWYDWRYYYQATTLSDWGLGRWEYNYLHWDRPYEWYIDQGFTGLYANYNCAPSCTVMACKWYNPSFTNTVQDARNVYPAGGGGWYPFTMQQYLNLNHIPNTISSFTGPTQLTSLLNQGYIMIVCIDLYYLSYDPVHEHRCGGLNYNGGLHTYHAILIKGYRSTETALYFEVYDPGNYAAHYLDGTPLGRNRHLAVLDLEPAMTNYWPYLLAISPPSNGAQPVAPRSSALQPVDPAQVPQVPVF